MDAIADELKDDPEILVAAVRLGFAERIKNTQAFFEPDNLATLILKYEGRTALLVIDTQREFCDPKHPHKRGNEETVTVSERIQSLVPEFRKANIPVYAVYSSRNGERPAADIDFYKFAPRKEDILVAKDTDSAFWGSDIKEILEHDDKKLLLVCGFNQAACVLSTVVDARDLGFKVCLLEDLVGNDNRNRYCKDLATNQMKNAGTVMASSQAVLRNLRPLTACKSTPGI